MDSGNSLQPGAAAGLIEARRRSRSKTPFLRSSCDHENCNEGGEAHEHHHHAKKQTNIKKSPTVNTITEEAEPVVSVNTLSQQIASEQTTTTTKRSKRQQQTTKIITSDYSSADDNISPDKLKTTTILSDFVTSSTSTPIYDNNNDVQITEIISNNNKGKKSSGNTITTSTSTTTFVTSSKNNLLNIDNNINKENKQVKIILKKSKEMNQNDINNTFESNHNRIETSTPLNNRAVTRRSVNIVTSTNNGNFDLSQHNAYKEYKDAGEYWNKYPKTDYTYSKLSPHRRDIGNGFIAMPNMSRHSLGGHNERVDEMARLNPTQESYIRTRYETTRFTKPKAPVYTPTDYGKSTKLSNTNYNYNQHFESEDEVDFSEFDNLHTKYTRTTTTVRQETIIRRIFLTIFTTIFTSVDWVTSLFKRSNQTSYYSRMEQEQGLFGKIRSFFSNIFFIIFRYIYTFISTALFVDTLLLKTSKQIERNHNKKRFLLLLLILLPLLLFLAYWLLDDDNDKKLLIKSYLPLTNNLAILSTLKSMDWSNVFKFNINYNIFDNLNIPTISLYKSSQDELNMKKALTNDEYNDLIKNINNYIEKVINEKLIINNQKLNDNLLVIINKEINDKIINNNFINKNNYQLNDNDINRIVELILNNNLFKQNYNNQDISDDNLEKITLIVQNELSKSRNNDGNDKSVNMDEIAEEITLKILSSDKLSYKIDDQIMKKLDIKLKQQDANIFDLTNELFNIKNIINLNVINKNDEEYLNLKLQHTNLLDLFNNYKINNNERYNQLIDEFNTKLTLINEELSGKINSQLKNELITIFGFGNDNNINDVNIKEWIYNLFVAKTYLEERLNNLQITFDENIHNYNNNIKEILLKEITEKINNEILIKLNEQKLSNDNLKLNLEVNNNLINDDHIKEIVKDALAIYDADKTGLVDYALESAGGQVLSTRCTESYQMKTAQISIFGIPLWYPTNTPRTAIAPSVQPGECWAFQGFPGFLVIKLNVEIIVTGFTMEHIPKSLAPNGQIDSAPKKFTVLGLKEENDPEPFLFGQYEYLDNSTSLQYFPVQNKNTNISYQIVELRIDTNYGNQRYTCLYRFRVHGKTNY